MSMSMSNTICWVDIPVVDVDRAIGFYSAVLGAEIAKQSHEGHAFGLLPHADNNVSGCLVTMPDRKPSENGPLVYLSVEGRLEEASQAAQEHGGKIVQGKHPLGPYGYRVIILDTEGNRVALHSQKA